MQIQPHNHATPANRPETDDASRPLHRLVRALETLPGEKAITLKLFDGRQIHMVVDADGRYGDGGFGQKELFLARIVSALYAGGVMLIRQITPLRMEVVGPGQERHMRPICNVYGVALSANDWVVVPAEHVEWACTHDAQTGAPLDREPNVRYLALPVPR